MTSRRALALGLVLLAAVAAGLVRVVGDRPPHSVPAVSAAAVAPAAHLEALRRAAALAPCPPGLGPDLPDVSLPCLGGGPAVALSSRGSGVVTLVNVYGSWCGPCADEMPLLASFSRRAGTRVRLVGVDDEDDPALALPFARDLGQRWPAVVDDDKVVARRYGAGVPVTLFLTAAGRVVHVQHGAFTSLRQIVAAVALHLRVQV